MLSLSKHEAAALLGRAPWTSLSAGLAGLLELLDLLLELGIFLAVEAGLLQHRQPLLGLGQVLQLEIELAHVLVGAEMLGLQLERLLVVDQRLAHIAGLAVAVAE